MRLKTMFSSAVLAASLAMGSGAAVADTVSDTWSEASLTTAYLLNEHLNPFDIVVEVRAGRAVLSGVVSSEVEKELAGEIAKATKGVTRVENDLKVMPQTNAARESGSTFARKFEDASITAKVKSQLLWNSATRGLDIDVETDNGVVTLTGEVGSEGEAALARQIALNTRGVRAVKRVLDINQQSVGDAVAGTAERAAEIAGHAVSDTWITAKVKSALLYNRHLDGTAIEVHTKDGTVLLDGAVSSTKELAHAVDIAKGIIGVKQVKSSIDVAAS
jgi:hyperosmotically inducible protein